MVKTTLNFGSQFINLEELDESGRTILIRLARNYNGGYRAEVFKLLLDRGANIHARDPEGRTCLQTAVLESAPMRDPKEGFDAVVLLIQRGADVFTTDNQGCSIFDTAYECDHGSTWHLGSYRGDFLDAVLSRCGYGEYIRRPEDRLCHYTKRYTSAHFRRLWEGREHLCPYFYGPSPLCPVPSESEWESEWESEEDEGEDEEEHEEEHEDDRELSGCIQGQGNQEELAGLETGKGSRTTNSEQNGSDFGDFDDLGGILLG